MSEFHGRPEDISRRRFMTMLGTTALALLVGAKGADAQGTTPEALPLEYGFMRIEDLTRTSQIEITNNDGSRGIGVFTIHQGRIALASIEHVVQPGIWSLTYRDEDDKRQEIRTPQEIFAEPVIIANRHGDPTNIIPIDDPELERTILQLEQSGLVTVNHITNTRINSEDILFGFVYSANTGWQFVQITETTEDALWFVSNRNLSTDTAGGPGACEGMSGGAFYPLLIDIDKVEKNADPNEFILGIPTIDGKPVVLATIRARDPNHVLAEAFSAEVREEPGVCSFYGIAQYNGQ